MEKTQRKRSVLRFPAYVFLVVQAVAFILAGMKLKEMDILPATYMIMFIGVAVFFMVLQAVLTLLVFRRKIGFILIMIFSILVTTGAVWAYTALKEVDDTIDEVTDTPDEVITEMAILVLSDSEIEDVTDMAQYSIGYVDTLDVDATNELKDEINKSLGTTPDYVSFNNIMHLADALYSRTINAIIINTAFIEIISETEAYANFKTDTKEIYSAEIKGYMNLVDEDDESNTKVKETFIVYISGNDHDGAIQKTHRSDVNLLLAVNTKTKSIQMINTPRDYFITFPNTGEVKDKLTHAGLYGVQNSMGALENLYGIKIDYYVRMNFSGFVAIIDALGGIDVNSEFDFTVEPVKHYVVGVNHLNGIEALAFARERHAFPKGDVQRGIHQMEVVRATLNKMMSPAILYSYTDVLESMVGIAQTSISSEEIYGLVKMQLKDMSEWNFQTYTVTGSGANSVTFSMPTYSTYVMVPNEETVETAKQLINNVLNPEPAEQENSTQE